MRRDVGRLTFGYFTYSEKIGITLLVSADGDTQTTPITIWDGHNMTILEFAEECEAKTKQVKEKKDVSYQKKTAAAAFMPAYLFRIWAWFIQYVNVNLGFGIPGVAKKESIGHYVVTDVGSQGIQQGFAPLYPSLQHLGLTSVGAIRKVPVVVDGELRI